MATKETRTNRLKRIKFLSFLLLALGVLAVAVLVPAMVLADPGQDDPLPPEKAAYIEREERLEAEARADPPPPGATKPPEPSPPPASVPPEFDVPRIPAGAGMIIETGLAPYSSGQYLFENRWLEVKEGSSILVYAGKMGSDFDESQGVVLVVVYGADPLLPVGGAGFVTPAKDGSVRVIGAEGERLTLELETGTTFFFDVPTCAFVAADAPVLPADPSCAINKLATPVPGS